MYKQKPTDTKIKTDGQTDTRTETKKMHTHTHLQKKTSYGNFCFCSIKLSYHPKMKNLKRKTGKKKEKTHTQNFFKIS